MATVTCTKCEAVLKTKAAVTPGKKMKCPKCAQVFVVEDEEEEKRDIKKNGSRADPQEIADDEDEAENKKATEKRKKSGKTEPDEAEDDVPPKKKSKSGKKGKPTAKAKGSPIALVIGVAAVLLLCLVGGGGAAAWFFLVRSPGVNKDSVVKGKDADSKDKPSTDKIAKPLAPDVTVNAESITRELDADSKAFAAKYKDKVFEVTGEVYTVGIDRVVLKGIPNPKVANSVVGVSCELPNKEWDKSHLLARGQKVKVTGKVEVYFTSFVCLKNCSLVEFESTQLAKVTAQEIAKALDGDGKKADEKLNAVVTKGAIVTGTVDRVMPRSPNMDYQHKMYLNIQTKTRLVLPIEVPRSKTLPVKGQTIEFRTTSGFYYGSFDNEFTLPGILLSVK